MKKLTMVAAVAVAAAIGTATLAACGGKKLGADKFKISDYAHSLTSVYAKNNLEDYADTLYVNDAYTTVTKKNYTNINYLNGNFATVYDGKTYAFYDVEKDVELFSGLCTSVEIKYVSGNRYGFNYYSMVTKNADGAEHDYSVKYAGPDGNLLTQEAFGANSYNSTNNIRFNYEKSYINDDGDIYEYFKMRYESQSSGDEVVKYYSLTKDDEGKFVFEGVSEQDVENAETEFEYKAGSQLGLIKHDLDVAKDYPSNSYKNIKYTVEGGLTQTYTYYNGNSKLSSLSITDGEIVAYVGDYVYFVEKEYVSVDAEKGYNLEINAGNGTIVKSIVKLYRYDFMKGRGLKEIDMKDYVVLAGQALYNYSTGEFDAIIVGAYKKVNGIAVASDKPYMLVLNKNGKVIADLSGTNIYNLNNLGFYKLNDNRYLAGCYILDGDCSVVAQLPNGNSYVWAEKRLIKCGNNMLVDYDGKVVIEPADGTLYFYGDVACTNSGTIYSKVNPSGIEFDEVVSVNTSLGETVSVSNGIIVKKSPVVGSNRYNYTIYDLNGTEIGSISNVAQNSIAFNKMGSKLVASHVPVVTDLAEGKTDYVSYIIG